MVDPGGGGGGPPGARAPPPPPPPPPPPRPFCSSNYIFIVAQYSVLNCILNVQLSTEAYLGGGGGGGGGLRGLGHPPPSQEWAWLPKIARASLFSQQKNASDFQLICHLHSGTKCLHTWYKLLTICTRM